ncbi:hypothetical protein GRJ2_000390600 [Grus japonensis]|uniref:Uncharacterized protein n=1 Tax=Grus japonensis TaxID=30415 RepID=A0ABC9W183_GRUJA
MPAASRRDGGAGAGGSSGFRCSPSPLAPRLRLRRESILPDQGLGKMYFEIGEEDAAFYNSFYPRSGLAIACVVQSNHFCYQLFLQRLQLALLIWNLCFSLSTWRAGNR